MTDDDSQYAPEGAICPKCSQFVPNNEPLERYLAAKRIKFYDVKRGRVVTPQGRVRYCNCTGTETARPRYAE